MIEMHELTKRYGDHLAVDRVTFTARPGRVTPRSPSRRRRRTPIALPPTRSRSPGC